MLNLKANSPEVSFSNGVKRYVGVTDAKLIAFQPTKGQLAKFYNKPESDIQDPAYKNIDQYKDGRLFNKFTMLFSATKDEETFTFKHDILVSKQYDTRGEGSVYFFTNFRPDAKQNLFQTQIRRIGTDKLPKFEDAVSNIVDNPKMGWFTNGGVVQALRVGEAELYNFLMTFLNYESAIDIVKELPFEVFTDYQADQVAELKALLEGSTDNGVKVLLTVRASGSAAYQQVYPRFWRLTDSLASVSNYVTYVSDYDGGKYNFPKKEAFSLEHVTEYNSAIHVSENDQQADAILSDGSKDNLSSAKSSAKDTDDLPF